MVLPTEDKKNMNLTKRMTLKCLFIIYIGVLLRNTVFRSGFGFRNLCKNGIINLTLFESYIPLIKSRDIIRIIYLFVGNIIWFVPFGFYLRRFGKRERKSWEIWLLGLLLSFIIEFLQYVFGTGISEMDDLILNSLGAWMGAVLGKRRKK